MKILTKKQKIDLELFSDKLLDYIVESYDSLQKKKNSDERIGVLEDRILIFDNIRKTIKLYSDDE